MTSTSPTSTDPALCPHLPGMTVLAEDCGICTAKAWKARTQADRDVRHAECLTLAARWIGANARLLSTAYDLSARWDSEPAGVIPVVYVQGHYGTLTDLVGTLGASIYRSEYHLPDWTVWRAATASGVRVEITETGS